MCDTMVIQQCSLHECFKMRKHTEGPEIDLVREFVNSLCERNTHSSRKTKDIVFLEPHIDSGYPDIVVARYDDSVLDNWVEDRCALTDIDLRILSYFMQQNRGLYLEEITHVLGFDEKELSASLALLSDCHLVKRNGKRWRSEKKSSFLGIHKLVAIEAKMSDTACALTQAFRNTRFASHSYALLGSQNPVSRTKDLYRKFGVGIFAGDNFEEIVKPEAHRLPGCYVTLQFNEWIAAKMISSADNI